MANSILGRHSHTITAILSVVLALVAAALIDRALRRGYSRRPAALRDPALDTRLRFARRIIGTGIVLLGVAVALSQFDALDHLAASIFASSAIAAAVVGFAARQPLANAMAGILLALTQPLRIGDTVTFQGETGTVEDVRLTSTYLVSGSGARIIIPNEMLAAGILRNATSAGAAAVTANASVWLGHDADVEAALTALADALPEATADVADVTEAGVRISLSESVAEVSGRDAAEARLRRRALAALRSTGIPGPAGGGATAQG